MFDKSLPTSAPCDVFPVGERGPGGAFHHYVIQSLDAQKRIVVRHEIVFQKGPRGEFDSTPGVFEDGLAAVLQDRLEAFQAGQFACDENAAALVAIKTYRAALASRTDRRRREGTLGTNNGT